MDRLVIYNIDDKYIEYLREFDNKVEVNKKSEGYKRPYVGIVLNVNKKLIQSKAEKLYNLYTKLEDKNNLKMRCCNFKLLEEKCELYNSIKK